VLQNKVPLRLCVCVYGWVGGGGGGGGVVVVVVVGWGGGQNRRVKYAGCCTSNFKGEWLLIEKGV
jgi:hypothetical protein